MMPASSPDKKNSTSEAKRPINYGLIAWLIIFACWVPVFLAEYPGFFVYDATDEYVEVATRVFNTHHPLLHVLMLGGSVCAGNKFAGDFNVGIAMYVLFQMLVVSGVFAWMITRMRRSSGKDGISVGYVCSILWYGLFPTVVMFALCSAKDTLFATALCVSVVLSVEILRLMTVEKCIALSISLCIMMLLRHNGVYGFIVYAFFMLLYVCLDAKKKNATSEESEQQKKQATKKTIYTIAVTMAVALCAYKVIDIGLIAITHAEHSESQEILTVPIQQLARTWSAYGQDTTPESERMTDEQLETLYEILPPEVLTHYTPNLSDPVKAGFDNVAFNADRSKYVNLWWQLFKEHPLGYVKAWVATSCGYYCPGTVVNVYAGHEMYTFTYDESSYFGYEVEYPGQRHSLLPRIDSFYRWLSLDDDIQRIQFVSWPFSMAMMFFLFLAGFVVLLFRRSYAKLTALTLPGAVWLTLLLGPTYLPRYVVFLWFLAPYLLHLLRTDKVDL